MESSQLCSTTTLQSIYVNVNTIKYSGQSVYEEILVLVFGLCTGKRAPSHLVLATTFSQMVAFDPAQSFGPENHMKRNQMTMLRLVQC